ncbi:MAG: hypothetical protein AAGC95_16365 [Pseudomonadota bacterium]
MQTAEFIVTLFGVYFAIGAVFAVPFVIWGAPRIDAGARGAGWGFRSLIFFGSMALWPIMAPQWLFRKAGEDAL